MFSIRVRKTRVDNIDGFLIGSCDYGNMLENQFSLDDSTHSYVRFYQNNEMDLLEKRFKNLLNRVGGQNDKSN